MQAYSAVLHWVDLGWQPLLPLHAFANSIPLGASVSQSENVSESSTLAWYRFTKMPLEL